MRERVRRGGGGGGGGGAPARGGGGGGWRGGGGVGGAGDPVGEFEAAAAGFDGGLVVAAQGAGEVPGDEVAELVVAAAEVDADVADFGIGAVGRAAFLDAVGVAEVGHRLFIQPL